MPGGGPKKYLDDTLRPDNEAGGPFPAHPSGATCFSPRLGGAPPRRIVRIDTARRRYLMRGENHVVAGSLGFETGSRPSAREFRRFFPGQIERGCHGNRCGKG